MLGNVKALQRNNRECKGILIGPLMAPRFSRPPRFRQSVFHSLSKSRSRLRAQISRRGWQADVTSRMCRTRTRSPAGASFEWDFFDFRRDLTGSGCSRSTSTVTSCIRSWRRDYRLPCIGRSQAERINCSMSLFKQQILTFEASQRNLSQILIVYTKIVCVHHPTYHDFLIRIDDGHRATANGAPIAGINHFGCSFPFLEHGPANSAPFWREVLRYKHEIERNSYPQIQISGKPNQTLLSLEMRRDPPLPHL
jgi:hypothetical protein